MNRSFNKKGQSKILKLNFYSDPNNINNTRPRFTINLFSINIDINNKPLTY